MTLKRRLWTSIFACLCFKKIDWVVIFYKIIVILRWNTSSNLVKRLFVKKKLIQISTEWKLVSLGNGAFNFTCREDIYEVGWNGFFFQLVTRSVGFYPVNRLQLKGPRDERGGVVASRSPPFSSILFFRLLFTPSSPAEPAHIQASGFRHGRSGDDEFYDRFMAVSRE